MARPIVIGTNESVVGFLHCLGPGLLIDVSWLSTTSNAAPHQHCKAAPFRVGAGNCHASLSLSLLAFFFLFLPTGNQWLRQSGQGTCNGTLFQDASDERWAASASCPISLLCISPALEGCPPSPIMLGLYCAVHSYTVSWKAAFHGSGKAVCIHALPCFCAFMGAGRRDFFILILKGKLSVLDPFSH